MVLCWDTVSFVSLLLSAIGLSWSLFIIWPFLLVPPCSPVPSAGFQTRRLECQCRSDLPRAFFCTLLVCGFLSNFKLQSLLQAIWTRYFLCASLTLGKGCGHTQQCLGFAPGSVLRKYSWLFEDHMECQRSNLGRPHAKQAPWVQSHK